MDHVLTFVKNFLVKDVGLRLQKKTGDALADHMISISKSILSCVWQKLTARILAALIVFLTLLLLFTYRHKISLCIRRVLLTKITKKKRVHRSSKKKNKKKHVRRRKKKKTFLSLVSNVFPSIQEALKKKTEGAIGDHVGLWQTMKKHKFLTAVLLPMLSVVAYGIYTSSVTTCDILHAIDNGSIECVGSWYNNSVGINCSFACDESYQLTGGNEIKCNESGMWSHEVPKCVKICDKLPKVPHGKPECSGKLAGSFCSVECNESFKVEGVGEIKCNESGKWSHEFPECLKICDKPPEVPHGKSECSGDVAGSVCSVKCDESYKVEGVQAIKCSESGKWSYEVPECVKICDKPPEVPHGKSECSGDVAGSVCYVKCDESYKVEGVEEIKCSESGKWPHEIPKCIKICDERPEVQHGELECNGKLAGSVCFVKCNESYKIEGGSKIKCSEAGKWSREVPKCVKICDKPPKVPDGELDCNDNVAGSVCTVNCNESYKVEGENKIKCSESGKWSREVPKCVKICDERPKVPHGELECNGDVAGSVCTVKCDESRKLEGLSHIVCDEDGKWSSGNSSCVCKDWYLTGEKCNKYWPWQQFKYYWTNASFYQFVYFLLSVLILVALLSLIIVLILFALFLLKSVLFSPSGGEITLKYSPNIDRTCRTDYHDLF